MKTGEEAIAGPPATRGRPQEDKERMDRVQKGNGIRAQVGDSKIGLNFETTLRLKQRLTNAKTVRRALRGNQYVVARVGEGIAAFERVLQVRERRGVMQVKYREDKPWTEPKGVWTTG